MFLVACFERRDLRGLLVTVQRPLSGRYVRSELFEELYVSGEFVLRTETRKVRVQKRLERRKVFQTDVPGRSVRREMRQNMRMRHRKHQSVRRNDELRCGRDPQTAIKTILNSGVTRGRGLVNAQRVGTVRRVPDRVRCTLSAKGVGGNVFATTTRSVCRTTGRACAAPVSPTRCVCSP